jgi:hypothetical protein
MVIISNINIKGDKHMARLNENQKALVKTIVDTCKTPAEVTAMLKELFAVTI